MVEWKRPTERRKKSVRLLFSLVDPMRIGVLYNGLNECVVFRFLRNKTAVENFMCTCAFFYALSLFFTRSLFSWDTLNGQYIFIQRLFSNVINRNAIYKLFGVLLVDFGLFLFFLILKIHLFVCCRRLRCRRRRWSWFATHKMHGKTERTRTKQFKRIEKPTKKIIIIKWTIDTTTSFSNHKQTIELLPEWKSARKIFFISYVNRLYSHRLSVVLFLYWPKLFNSFAVVSLAIMD